MLDMLKEKWVSMAMPVKIVLAVIAVGIVISVFKQVIA